MSLPERAKALLLQLQALQVEFDAEETGQERLLANVGEQLATMRELRALGVDDVTIQTATHTVAKKKVP